MPLLATVLLRLLSWIYGLSLAMFGAKWAVRITAATTIAGLYVACAVTFTTLIGPWLAGLFSTSYGYLLGLLFPPIAGTVLASLGTFWACVLAKRHTARLIKMTINGE